MSKLMFAFVLVCSALLYNPDGLRDFAKMRAPEIGWHLKNAALAVDRLLPSFMRFTRD